MDDLIYLVLWSNHKWSIFSTCLSCGHFGVEYVDKHVCHFSLRTQNVFKIQGYGYRYTFLTYVVVVHHLMNYLIVLRWWRGEHLRLLIELHVFLLWGAQELPSQKSFTESYPHLLDISYWSGAKAHLNDSSPHYLWESEDKIITLSISLPGFICFGKA